MSSVDVLPETLPRWKIPSGWKWVSIADVGKVITGNTPPTKDESNYGNFIPFVKPPALTDKGIRSTSEGLSETGVRSSRTLPAGAVLVSCIGGLGKTGIAKVPMAFNQQINAIVFDQRVVPEFGFYYAQTLKPWLHGVASATTLPIVNKGKFQRAPFPLAPLDQQKRIVAEIEKQFSRLDDAVANLKRVKANLKRYKAAVLKAAVEGRLVETEAERARREGRSYETGAQLLQRILETRRSQWQGKGKYKEPAAPDTTVLPELPEGWVWASVDQLLISLRNGLSKKPEDTEPGMPILRISAVRPLELDTKDRRFYRPHENERVDDYKLQVGDVLFVRYNGTKELVGVCALVNTLSGAILYPDKLIRGRVVSEQLVLPSYLAISANVGKSRQHIDELIKTTAGQQGIAGGEIKQMPLPLPPYAEQLRIVVEIDRRLSLIRETEVQVDANFRRAERLRQSILSRAFSGKPHQIISAVSAMEMHTHG